MVDATSPVKRVLLIGASKHIGYHVLETLARQPEKYSCYVLARTPAAKITPFKGKENVTFIQGDAKDQKTVTNAIHAMNGNIDFVIVTIGAALVFKKFIIPANSDPTLCGTIGKAVVAALKETSCTPVVVAISSTGVLSTKDLLPLALKPLYRGLLKAPLQDKIEMENAITQGYEAGRWTILRPALLTEGKRTGKYRAGETEVGYTIRRTDVADFIVEQCIEGEGKWLGKRPVLVY